MFTSLVTTFLLIYVIIAIAFVFINAFIAGFMDIKIKVIDIFLDSIMWPLSIVISLGTIVRYIVKKPNSNKDK